MSMPTTPASPPSPGRAPSLMVVLGLLLTSPGISAAQVELSVGGGLYVPTTTVGKLDRGTEPSVTRLSWCHETAAHLGGRLTVWVTHQFGVETAVSYSSSNVKRKEDHGSYVLTLGEEDAAVLAATGRAVWRFGGRSGLPALHLLVGLGIITRSGNAYEEFAGMTDPTAVVGSGLRVSIGPNLLLRFDVEDYIYPAEIKILGQPTVRGRAETSLGSHVQNDLAISQTLVLEF